MEDPVEAALRRRILDDAGLPYMQVAIDPASRVPGDVHPMRAPGAIDRLRRGRQAERGAGATRFGRVNRD